MTVLGGVLQICVWLQVVALYPGVTYTPMQYRQIPGWVLPPSIFCLALLAPTGSPGQCYPSAPSLLRASSRGPICLRWFAACGVTAAGREGEWAKMSLPTHATARSGVTGVKKRASFNPLLFQRSYPKIDRDNPYFIGRFDGIVLDAKPWGRGLPELPADGSSGGAGAGAAPWPAAPLNASEAALALVEASGLPACLPVRRLRPPSCVFPWLLSGRDESGR